MKTDKTNPLILIVDDVNENLQVLGNILNKNDYRISFATNGKEALNMLKKIEPDLILLDIMMPGLDGFETCKQIKANDKTKDIPVIFLTAKNEQEDIVGGFQIGAVDYVKKPFNSPELLARIKTHIELRKAKNIIAKMKEKEMFQAMVVT
ncbi:MAG: response regulator, partial [Calditrichia bacterium]|nr:response regulator [Calditrichia bacterium]